MEKVIAKPQLGFGEALKLACSRLLDFSGRSRRSEFWWFMLVFVIVSQVLGSIVSLALSSLGSQIATAVIMFFALPITVRRLQDTGKSRWWVILSFLCNVVISVHAAQSGFLEELTSVNADPMAAAEQLNLPLIGICGLVFIVTSLATFIFCLMDSNPEANKYGPSPKYEVVEE